jgi:hypothetical protein
MNNHMNKNVKILLELAILVAVALLVTLWAATYVLKPSLPPIRPPGEIRHIEIVRGDIELFYTVQTIISTINVTLLIFLLITYIGIYRKTHSEFTIGLIIFSIVLLFYALSSDPLVQWTFGFRAFGLGPFAMLPDLFTCAALAVLLYLTVKY